MAKAIEIGIVGLGRAGWGMHCAELAGKEKMFRVAAVCDIFPARCAMAAEKYDCRTYNKIEELIADPKVELVDIATRSPDHLAHARLALKAGKDVFLEKPICLDYAQTKKLKAAADKSAGNLYIRHNRRFEPGFLHIREIIASGVLGEIFEIKIEHVGEFNRRDDWQSIASCGGGLLLNWGPHLVDQALRLLDAPITSIWGDLKHVAAAGDAEDHVKIVMKAANGRVADIEVSGGAVTALPEFSIWGTRGGLCLTASVIALKYLDPKLKLPPRKANPGDPNLQWGSPDDLKWIEKTMPVQPKKLYDIWVELYRAIREGKPFPIKNDDAIEVMRVISEARRTGSQ